MRAFVRRLLDPVLRGQQSESLRRSLVAGTAGAFVLNAGSLVWNLLGVVVLTRLLSAHAYGGYVYALAWSTLLAVPVVPLPLLLVREVAAYHARHEPGFIRGIILRSYQGMLAASAVVAVGAGVVGVLFIARGEPAVQRAYLIGLVVIPVVAAYQLNEAVMRGFGRVIEGRLADSTVQPLLLILFLLLVSPLARPHLGSAVAMALTLASALGAVLVSLTLMRRVVPPQVWHAEPRYETRRWWRSLRPLVLISGASALQTQIGIVLVGVLGTVADSGVFNVALRWSVFVSFVQTAVNFPLAPAVARLHARGERVRLQRLVSNAARVATGAALPVALVLVLFNETALRIFGAPFTSGATALTILVIGEAVNVASGSVLYVLLMTNHERVVASVNVAAAVTNALLCLVLIPSLGVAGAAIARAVSLGGSNIVLVWQLWRRERIYSAVLGRRLIMRLSHAAA